MDYFLFVTDIIINGELRSNPRKQLMKNKNTLIDRKKDIKYGIKICIDPKLLSSQELPRLAI